MNQRALCSARRAQTAHRLFADLRGSLSLISGRDPEQADEILGGVTGLMLDAVARHDGTMHG